MTIVTKKHLSRRTMLRGLGVADFAAAAGLHGSGADGADQDRGQRGAAPGLHLRSARRGDGQVDAHRHRLRLRVWPLLSALEAHRDNVIVLSNLCHHMAEALGDGGADHSRATATWLNGTHAKKTEGEDVRAGTTIDQMAAAQYRPEHALPFAGTRHRRHDRSDRRLRRRLQLRLHEHDFLEHAHHAAAHGDQPARGVRAAVRRRRHACRSAWRAWTKTGASWIRSLGQCPACKRAWARAIARA